MRYFIVLAAAAALIGGAVVLLTQSTPAPERETTATAPRKAARADLTGPSPPLPNAGRDERIAAAPGAGALDDAERQAGPAEGPGAPAAVAAGAPQPARTMTPEPLQAAEARPLGAAGGPVLAAVDPTPAGRAGQAAVKAAIDPRDPTFDIVRITREGNAVIAGRAEPGAEVTVREQGQTLGTVRANARGEWVLIPAEPLAPGATQLTIVAALPGAETRQSNDVVILSVPQRNVTVVEEPAIAILSPRRPERAARVLQGPLGPVLRAEGGAGVGLDIVDYDERGDVVFAGRAEPNVLVRLYADNELVGTATADAAGDWQLTADRPIAPGDHEVRVDAVTDSGEVLGRVAMPFTRAAVSSIALRNDRVIVQPGNSLWRIARATLGEGIRYTVIYEANRERIRDPNLIYPGQIFSIPATN